jgi:hypothetical protein
MKNISTDLINELPGNISVNKIQHTTTEEAVFSVVPTDAPTGWLDSSHVVCVYCRSMSIPLLYNESRELKVQSELEVGVQKSTRSQPVKISRVNPITNSNPVFSNRFIRNIPVVNVFRWGTTNL